MSRRFYHNLLCWNRVKYAGYDVIIVRGRAAGPVMLVIDEDKVNLEPDTGGGRQKYGTNVILSCMKNAGVHPVRNFQKGKFDGFRQINEETLRALYVQNRACFGCPNLDTICHDKFS